MSRQLNISANEFFELIRPAVIIFSAILSTWVFASSRRRFSFVVALIWALATLFFTPIVFPLYLAVLLVRRKRELKTQIPWRLMAPLVYLAIVVCGIALYLDNQSRGVDEHLARAVYARMHGNRLKTIAEYRAALREKDDPHTHKLLAIELRAQGDWTEALAEFRLAEQGGEPDDWVILNIASLLELLNQPSQAQLEYKRFLESGSCTQPLPDSRCAAVESHIQKR